MTTPHHPQAAPAPSRGVIVSVCWLVLIVASLLMAAIVFYATYPLAEVVAGGTDCAQTKCGIGAGFTLVVFCAGWWLAGIVAGTLASLAACAKHPTWTRGLLGAALGLVAVTVVALAVNLWWVTSGPMPGPPH